MKASICIETIFTEYPFYERFGKVKETGFKYVEFWSWDDKDLGLIKVKCAELGLTVASFSGDKDFSLIDKTHNDNYLAYLEKSIEAAKYLGCENLVIHSNALGEGGHVVCDYKGYNKDALSGNMKDVLKKAKEYAGQSGITLVLEALNTITDHTGNFLWNTKGSVNAVKAAGSDYIKILYDAYHMQIMEGNIINTLADNISSIGYIHIADVPGRNEPGTGEINYVNVFHALDLLGYDGFAGFELFPKHDSLKAIAAIKKLTDIYCI